MGTLFVEGQKFQAFLPLSVPKEGESAFVESLCLTAGNG